MSGFNAEYINMFLMAASKVLSEMCAINVKVEKPVIKDAQMLDNSYAIIIGITGEMRGQVMLHLSNEVACEIASKMCMMPITQIDEISASAICELGNMIMGNAATLFFAKGVVTDITPPTLSHGSASFKTAQTKSLCVPMTYGGGKVIEMHLSIMGA